MTIQDAKKTLAKNWWKFNNSKFGHEDYIIEVGELISENDDYYHDHFIIAVIITNKKSNEKEQMKYAVSKIDGKCRPAIRF